MQSFIFYISSLICLQLSSRLASHSINTRGFFAEATPTVAPEIQAGINGYECGNVFFTDKEVRKVVSRCLEKMERKVISPMAYQGPLYSEEESKDYLLWRIKKHPSAYETKGE